MKAYRPLLLFVAGVFGIGFVWYMYFSSNVALFLDLGGIIRPANKPFPIPLKTAENLGLSCVVDNQSANMSILLSHKKANIFIPHIIHHKWNSNMVPKGFQSILESWKTNHPHWEQWWWNDTNAKEFVAKRFPQHLQLYNSYSANLQRSDVLRYFKIFEFGGVYADLDIISLKPLDSLLENVSCAFGLEHEGHAYFYGFTFLILNNGFMACRPSHPFFKFMIDNLKKNLKEHPKSIHYTTGPLMVTTMLQKYNEIYPNSSIEDSVTIFPHQYIHPLLDECGIKKWKKDCSRILKTTERNTKLQQLKYEACTRLMAKNFTNGPTEESYCNHLWNHCYKVHRKDKALFKIETLLNITGPPFCF